ncbi:MAG: dTMP kinase [Nitratireductor sp.]
MSNKLKSSVSKSQKSQDKTKSSQASDAPKRKGIFITLEGGEGAGKSSQIVRLEKRFEKLGHKVLLTREPGGSPGAEAVRHVLLSGAAEKFGPEMEAILFSAARGDHVENVITPALNKNKTVICDRFFDSTRVYQGITGNVPMSLLHSLEKIACGSTWPDLTLILDLDPSEGMARANKRRDTQTAPDRFEKESLKLQQKRREGFLSIAKQEPNRCKVIDASGSEAEVAERIWAIVSEHFNLKNK